MTTEEHDSQTLENAGQASQAQTSQKGDAPISLDESAVEAFLQHPKVQAYITGVAEKKVKSQKDRRIAGLEKDVQEILGQLNLSPEQQAQVKSIQQEQLLTQLTDAVFNQDAGSPNTPAKGVGGTTVDLVGAFGKAGYDVSNISLSDWEWAEKFQGTETELANALVKKRLSVGTYQEAPVTPAAVMPTGSNVATAAPGSQAALMREYQAKLDAIPMGSVDAVLALKREFRKKGLNIF